MGTQWALESFGTPGAETPVIGETPPTLEFTLDGQVGGNGGCNSFGGSYQVEGNTLVLGEIVSTLVACVDTALMNQEVEYLNALQTVTQFQVDGDRLAITYNEGQGILNFVSAAATLTETPAPEAEAPVTEPVAESPTGDSQNFIWHCYSCSGNQVWNFENGQASHIELPVEINYFFGYAPATGRVLYDSPLPVMGGGPSQISVGDLWSLDVATGEAQPLINEQTVVEAEWAPDGEHFVYVLATDTTYELRWRGLDGEDKLLASDVAFTFSVSPRGDKVAFTRESNYGLPGQPGLYVVDVTTAE
jgi:putative lipoprotein